MYHRLTIYLKSDDKDAAKNIADDMVADVVFAQGVKGAGIVCEECTESEAITSPEYKDF